MIQCNVCGFSVNELMKFALMNNTCPSCGGALFSGKDNNIINMIQTKLSSERFASKLTEELIYDISLFIFNELKDGIGKSLRQELVIEEDIETEYQEDNEEDAIRKEIEAEYSEQLSQLTDDGEVISEDISDRAMKLKRMREQQLLRDPFSGQEVPIKRHGNNAKSGPRVNRVER